MSLDSPLRWPWRLIKESDTRRCREQIGDSRTTVGPMNCRHVENHVTSATPCRHGYDDGVPPLPSSCTPPSRPMCDSILVSRCR